ncbi:H/ACA ribonucleoprotein complex non-core subunit NAF1 [Vanrija pseudolonga]|uniref:H/ACA ribonucleoprotein complex non-core subunit NAF1 n=1 Tax=Vanrija pseudolonga TaxID=143232 RepID=A0AAF1BF48_9TREE|nr:H/ACA ribonucleoprotein complex non-core subunit NAF1 [Vanrija pseudolonga]
MVDSDTEIELAIDPAPASAPAPAFAAPAAPVSDLDLIAQMVSSGEVVGALPPVSMSAAEKRAQVEASRSVPQYTGDESSSEEESSDEDEDDDEYKKPDATPMTAEQHASMKKELEEFTGEPAPAPSAATASVLDKLGGFEFVTDSEEEEDDDDDEVDMDDFDFDAPVEDDGEPGAIMSAHEQALPPVPQPPLEHIPATVPLVLAGDVVSWMKERGVEAWLEKQKAAGEAEGAIKAESAGENVEIKSEAAAAGDVEVKPEPATEAGEVTETKPTTEATESKPEPAADAAAPAIPKFNSSGTIIIRAMQAPGTGWLESGSVLTTADGHILGAVHDTFGPLTSPFYSVRLPPPPFPYPSLEAGDKVFFPQSADYRTFVDMHAVRDPRFRSDASNIYDEEVGDDEVEWSDDEAERAAKNRRKKKGKRAGSRVPGTPGSVQHPLPPRPHFDYAGNDDDSVSLHGDGADRWDEVSDAGSTASQRHAVVYDDDVPSGYGAQRPQRGRGRGRGGPRGGGGGGGRGQGRATGGGRPVHALPQRPGQWGQTAPMGGFGGAMPMQQQGGFQQQAGFWPQQQQPQFQPQFQQYNPAGYNPSQPGMGIPGFAPQGQDGSGNAPAINPRFAAQYQQMMGGYWPQQQQQQGGGGQYGGGYPSGQGPYDGQHQQQ